MKDTKNVDVNELTQKEHVKHLLETIKPLRKKNPARYRAYLYRLCNILIVDQPEETQD